MANWISEERVKRAIELRKEGKTWTAIASAFRTSPATIRAYVAKSPDTPAELLRPIYLKSDLVTQIGKMRDSGMSRADIRAQLRLSVTKVKHALSTYRHRQAKAHSQPKLPPGRSKSPWLSTECVQEALQLRLKGASWLAIGAAIGCDDNTAHRAVLQLPDLPASVAEPYVSTRYLIARVAELLDSGWSRKAICAELGLTANQVHGMAGRHRKRKAKEQRA